MKKTKKRKKGYTYVLRKPLGEKYPKDKWKVDAVEIHLWNPAEYSLKIIIAENVKAAIKDVEKFVKEEEGSCKTKHSGPGRRIKRGGSRKGRGGCCLCG